MFIYEKSQPNTTDKKYYKNKFNLNDYSTNNNSSILTNTSIKQESNYFKLRDLQNDINQAETKNSSNNQSNDSFNFTINYINNSQNKTSFYSSNSQYKELDNYMNNLTFLKIRLNDMCSDISLSDISLFGAKSSTLDMISLNDNILNYGKVISTESSFNNFIKNSLSKLAEDNSDLNITDVGFIGFIEESIIFLLLFIFCLIGWFTCCSCVSYDYCPILCKQNKKNKRKNFILMILPLNIILFISLGLIIPSYTSFNNFTILSKNLKLTLCNSMRLNYIIHEGKDFFDLNKDIIFWNGMDQNFINQDDDPWMKKIYQSFRRINEFSEIYNNVDDFLDSYNDVVNGDDENLKIYQIFNNLNDLKNFTEKKVFPKFIYEFNKRDKLSISQPQIKYNENSSTPSNLTDNSIVTNSFNGTNSNTTRFLQDDSSNSDDSTMYFIPTMKDFLENSPFVILDSINTTYRNLNYLRNNSDLLSEYKINVLRPIYERNKKINKLNAYFTYFTSILVEGTLNNILSYTNLFIFSYQIFILILGFILFIIVYFKINSNLFIKFLANSLWFLSGFMSLFIILSIMIYYFCYSFDYLYIYNVNQYQNNQLGDSTSFSECLMDYNSNSTINENLRGIEDNLENLTFYLVQSYVYHEYSADYPSFLKSMKYFIESYTNINYAFYNEENKAINTLKLFNQMIGLKTKFPFQTYYDCKKRINMEIVFDSRKCNNYYMEKFNENIDLTDNNFCFTLDTITPDSMDYILKNYIQNCNTTYFDLSFMISKAHNNIYKFYDSFQNFTKYISTKVSFELISKVSNLLQKFSSWDNEIYNEFTVPLNKYFGINSDNYVYKFGKSQEKGNKGVKTILEYNYKKLISCNYYKSLKNSMMIYLMENVILIIYKLIVSYVFILVYNIFLSIFSLMNAMLNFNRQDTKNKLYQFTTVLDME